MFCLRQSVTAGLREADKELHGMESIYSCFDFSWHTKFYSTKNHPVCDLWGDMNRIETLRRGRNINYNAARSVACPTEAAVHYELGGRSWIALSAGSQYDA